MKSLQMIVVIKSYVAGSFLIQILGDREVVLDQAEVVPLQMIGGEDLADSCLHPNSLLKDNNIHRKK